jgi:hypothetical protein
LGQSRVAAKVARKWKPTDHSARPRQRTWSGRSVPERPVHSLWADGGTVGGSPGKSVYFSVGTNQGIAVHSTSNRYRRSDEAELLALQAALQMVADRTDDAMDTIVNMDCQSLVSLVNRRRAPSCRRLQGLFSDVTGMLSGLEERGVRVFVRYVTRDNMVSVLGH